MPLYSFVCDKCGKKVEVVQAFDDSPPKCPETGEEMRRELCAPMVRKGAGLYSIDSPSVKKWEDME